MTKRALIVLLIVLNLGVAAWWASRPAVETETVEDPPSGIARLQLLSEAPKRAAHATPSAPATLSAPVAAVAASAAAEERCFAFGPYTDAQAMIAARAALQPQSLRLHTRQTTVTPARGWRVVLPPQADRAAAQAMADRISAAGITDYFVMSEGADANGIALGRYRTEPTAREREAALRAAGFPAQAQPIGAAATQGWIDIAVNAAFDPAAARRTATAAQAEPIDCATVR